MFVDDDALEAAKLEVKRLREALCRLEWCAQGGEACPGCGQWRGHAKLGHGAGCIVAAALKGVGLV